MSEIWKDIYFVENGIEYDFRGLYQVSNYGRVKSFHNGKEKILKAGKDKYGYEQVILCDNSKKKSFKVHRLVAFMFLSNSYFECVEVNHIDENKTNNNVSNLEWCDRKYNVNYGTRNTRAGESNKGKNPYAGKSDEELEEIRRKISEAMKKVWDNKSEEELAERIRKWHETMNNKSEEELAEIRRKQSEANKGEKNGMYGRTGEKHPSATLVDRFDKQGNYIDTKYQFEYVQMGMGFNASGISSCCTGRRKTHKGYIFKYHNE